MKPSFACFLVICVIVIPSFGCTQTTKTRKQPQKQDNPSMLARDLYQRAGDTSQSRDANDRANSFRDANERANGYLAANPDTLPKHNPGTKDRAHLESLLRQQPKIEINKLDDRALYEKFLETIVGLDKAEMEEVESPSFKLMDGHFLDGCYFMREVARSMPLQGLSALEQAQFCFGWVTRQVVLQQGRDELLPPQFVLRRGQGSAAERVFVFVSLLQQLMPRHDGCLIALPGKGGQAKPWLAGVLIAAQDKDEIYLFDPRLGLPVPGPQGKGIATLAQLRADPTLLDGLKVPGDVCQYDVSAAEVANAEILVASPISALSSRMRYLEDELLLGFDQICLTVRVADLLERIDKLKIGTARVWSAPALKPGLMAQTPTRALRLFLPPEEGGIDKSHRLKLFNTQLVPWPAFVQGFANQKPSKADPIGLDAEQQLELLAGQLWMNYVYTPSQELVRGRLDDCTKRLVRIQKVVNDVRGNNPDPADVVGWRKKVREAYVERDPDKIATIWGEDQWLRQLVVEPDAEPANPRLAPKKVLSEIVLGAVSEPIHLRCGYLLALRWQELGERTQVQANHLEGIAANRAAKVLQDVRGAWSNANSWWSGYEHSNPLAVKKRAKGSTPPVASGLLEYQDRNLREAAAAKLMHVHALLSLNEKDTAVSMLRKLIAELSAVEKELTPDRQRASTLESLSWIKFTACLELAKLEGPGG
jgi:hypothetical protein